MQWSSWRENDIPEVDDFAHFFDTPSGTLYCFGGYLNGIKSNILFSIDINAKSVKVLSPSTPSIYRNSKHVPCQRTSTRIVLSAAKNSIYLFGGLSVANDTLNDMWRFDLEANRWDQIEQKGNIPGPRCGHSFNIHCEKIFVFGGLKEVTQECNETFKFDIATSTWEYVNENAVRAFDSFTPIP